MPKWFFVKKKHPNIFTSTFSMTIIQIQEPHFRPSSFFPCSFLEHVLFASSALGLGLVLGVQRSFYLLTILTGFSVFGGRESGE